MQVPATRAPNFSVSRRRRLVAVSDWLKEAAGSGGRWYSPGPVKASLSQHNHRLHLRRGRSSACDVSTACEKVE